MSPLDNLEYDVLRGLQYCYYVKKVSIVNDDQFDKLEKKFNVELPVGSDNADDYSPAERAMGMYLLFTFYVQTKSDQLI